MCVGNVRVDHNVTVAGAGQGTDPAANTTLNANQEARVLWLKPGAAAVTLEKLRSTGGRLASDFGAGIVSQGVGLTLTNCADTGNEGSNATGAGIDSESTLQ